MQACLCGVARGDDESHRKQPLSIPDTVAGERFHGHSPPVLFTIQILEDEQPPPIFAGLAARYCGTLQTRAHKQPFDRAIPVFLCILDRTSGQTKWVPNRVIKFERLLRRWSFGQVCPVLIKFIATTQLGIHRVLLGANSRATRAIALSTIASGKCHGTTVLRGCAFATASNSSVRIFS